MSEEELVIDLEQQSPKRKGLSLKNCCFTLYRKHVPQNFKDVCSYLIYQRENCPTTGTLHWQGYAELSRGRRIQWIKDKLGDSEAYVEGRKGTAEEAKAYCCKTNSRAEPHESYEAGVMSKPREGKKGPSVKDTCRRAQLCSTRQEAEELFKRETPDKWYFNSFNLDGRLKKQFPDKASTNIPEREFAFNINPKMQQWLDTEFKKKERARCLIVVGPAMLGKTAWARSIGEHMYWQGDTNYGSWNQDAKYIVMDDVPWKYIPKRKQILGQKLDIVLTDKYVRKLNVNNDKPAIVLLNETPDFEEEREYWDRCSTLVHITEELFDRTQKQINL